MGNLGVDIKLLIAQITNFILFFIIFKKLMAKPFARFLAEEKKKEEVKAKLDQQIKLAEEKRKEEEKKFRLMIEQEREKIIKEAKTQAEADRKELIKKTEEELTRLREKAMLEIKRKQTASEMELKKKIISEITKHLEKTLTHYLSADTVKELTQNILKNSQLKS